MVMGKIELIKKSHGQQRQHRKYKEEAAWCFHQPNKASRLINGFRIS